MLDYEIDGYTVEFHRIGSVSDSEAHFDTEEEAMKYIKDSRHRWDKFILIQHRTAIIDF